MHRDRHVFRTYQYHGAFLAGTFQQRHTLSEHHCLRTVGDARQSVRQADECRHILGFRTTVQRLRVGDLLDASVVHHADPVGHRKRFFLIVRHEYGGGARFELDATDLVAQLHAHLGIQRG